MRLDKLLSNNGLGSRSQVRQLIKAGQVSLNGHVLSDPATLIDPIDYPQIMVRQQTLNLELDAHLLLNKPQGYLTATDDRRYPYVTQILPSSLQHLNPIPAGRLDRDAHGLLLLTTDGQLAHRLMSPRWHYPKTYLVTYEGESLTAQEIQLLARGLQLKDLDCLPAVLEPLANHKARITLTEGKYHQVKRMFAFIGRPVIDLCRISIGPFSLAGIEQPGSYRHLKEAELSRLYQDLNLRRVNP
ncbi:rRNA pseudouridine synthase [Oscillospiraceae bacterium HV4-5-C5C]|nr:rRNA pseudouridine synthase [Oscillospiraceae bacterium HV4-5-C5C]